MKRGKRRKWNQAHGHTWDRPGDFTLADPQRECTACGLVVTITKGRAGQIWILGLAEAAREAYRLPKCSQAVTRSGRGRLCEAEQ